MSIYYLISILIPILCTVYAVCFYPKKVNTYEILALFFAWLVCIGIFYLGLHFSHYDTEYFGDLIKSATYYEEWDELETYTTTSCNSKGVCHSETHTRIDNHPAEYEMESRTGKSFSIDRDDYYGLVKRWGGSQQFEDMHRDYYSKDGDAYHCYWNNLESTFVPVTWTHMYENKVMDSNDVFNYSDVSKEDIKHYGLYDYPKVDNVYQKNILGIKDQKAEDKLQFINAMYGPSKQFRCYIIVFKNKPEMAGKLQEALWKGGNKNELVYCIGIDDSFKIVWANVFSWCENQEMKIGARDYITSLGTINLSKICDYTRTTVIPQFKRKEFSDFSYIVNAPSTAQIIIFYVIIIIICIAFTVFIVTNDYNYDKPITKRIYIRTLKTRGVIYNARRFKK